MASWCFFYDTSGNFYPLPSFHTTICSSFRKIWLTSIRFIVFVFVNMSLGFPCYGGSKSPGLWLFTKSHQPKIVGCSLKVMILNRRCFSGISNRLFGLRYSRLYPPKHFYYTRNNLQYSGGCEGGRTFGFLSQSVITFGFRGILRTWVGLPTARRSGDFTAAPAADRGNTVRMNRLVAHA